MAITDIRPPIFCRLFQGLTPKAMKYDVSTAAGSLWRNVGKHGIAPGALGCDPDLITLNLAKDEGGIVYMKFDMSGWDE